MNAFLYEGPAWLLAKFYDFVPNYIVAISLMALVVMIITAPLQLKATKGMLEMQKLQPEMKKLQQEHRGDRQKLNEEMMKLYQGHKVNPLASCFPLLLQFPVFIVMFQVLHGLTYEVNCAGTNLSQGVQDACAVTGATAGKVFDPKFIPVTSRMWDDLHGQSTMMSWGLDLAARPINMIGKGFSEGIVYALLVLALGVLYFVQQRMVAARATVSPTMSASQQKLMQYLPVVFAVFLVFYLTGLVIYYMAQAIFRIGLQFYITKRFYAGEHSLGNQAMKAGEEAREIAKNDPNGGGGLFANAKKELAAAKETGKSGSPATPTTSKRVTPPKNKPTPARTTGKPPSSGQATRPAPSNKQPRK